MSAKPLTPLEEATLIALVRESIQKVANAYSKQRPAPANGYFASRSNHDGRIILLIEIGRNPVENSKGRCFNAQEKPERLFENPGHLLSWQTRNVEVEMDKRKYGGAIRTPDYILSFSGLPEAADESLMVVVAIKMGWLGKEDALDMLTISGNEIGKRLVEKLYK